MLAWEPTVAALELVAQPDVEVDTALELEVFAEAAMAVDSMCLQIW